MSGYVMEEAPKMKMQNMAKLTHSGNRNMNSSKDFLQIDKINEFLNFPVSSN